MLSKKMAVSLTSLITILALAFIAPTAMAATFGVKLDESNDISAAAGLQLAYPADNALKVKVVFDEAVVLPKANISISGFTMKGVYLPAVKLAADPPTDAAREIELTITITADTYRVSLMIAKGITADDPFSKRTSAALPVTDIGVLKDDTTLAPQVYGIRRADNAISPLTGGAVNVIITLSEQPKSFTAAHINVMSNNATAGTPVKLQTVAQNAVGLTQFSDHLDTPAPTARNVTQIRDGVVKPDAAVGAGDTLDTVVKADGAVEDGAMAGINHYLSVAMETNDTIPSDYLAAVITLKKAINAAAATTTDYYHDNKDGVLQAAVALQYEDSGSTPPAPGNNVSGMPIIDDAIVPPSKQATADLAGTGEPVDSAVTISIPAESFDRSKKKTDYKRPDPNAADLTRADLAFQLARYNALTGTAADTQRAAYETEKKIYDAYIALQKLIQEDDMDATAEWQESLVMKAAEGVSVIDDNVLPPTGRDGMLHPYQVTLTPSYTTADDIVVSVNKWETEAEKVNRETDVSSIGMYKPPVLATDYTEGYNQLTIPVSASAVKTPPATTPSGVIEVVIPSDFVWIAGSDGFTVFVADVAGSGIAIPGGSMPASGSTHTVAATARRDAHKAYNVVDYETFLGSPMPNLQTFLLSGGTIHFSGTAGLVISEVMWGTDISLSPPSNSQWIELKNVTGAPITGGGVLSFIGPNESLPAGRTSVDSVSTYNSVSKSIGWSILGKGSNGRTGTGESAAGVTTVVQTTDLVSMQRVFMTAAQRQPLPGNMATSWIASSGPPLNFDTQAIGARTGSPGSDPLNPAVPPPKPVVVTPTTPAATADDIKITEIMVDTSDGLFPQWIELTYSGTSKATLNGWEMVIDNAIDAEVLGKGNPITVSLSGITLDVSKDTGNLGAGQSALVVAWATRRHHPKIKADRVLNLGLQLGETGRYKLLSYEGFRIALVPPKQGAIAAYGDIAGNLDEEWDLPMLEGPKRASLIRREMDNKPNQATHVASMQFLGTQAKGWRLASETQLIKGPETFYGNDEDAGTPGYDAGGPLPVELSHFRPARDKQTGAVVITWATQSELNNAGFFIKRSNQRNGQFTVINPTMVPGAGTTSEKQFYTYTDTTAQPNVVYYYQIEDVSLDGNRQLLTRGIRLKGHVGAAGKATTLWGELKTSHE